MDSRSSEAQGDAGRRRMLRQAILAVAVLDDVDMALQPRGVELAAGGFLTWDDLVATWGRWAAEPAHPVTRARFAAAARAAAVVADGGAEALAAVVRVHAEPAGSALHPGPRWPVERLGPVEAGWGITGVPGTDQSRPLPPLPSLLALLPADPARGAVWSREWSEVDRLGRLCAERLERDRAAGRVLVLRPVGRADVATLLLSRSLRQWLADHDGTGLAAVAVPDRSRGWTDLRRLDLEFTMAAWSATDAHERGFARPLLVTADDVVLPGGVRDVLGVVLADLPVDPLVDPVAAETARS